MSEKDFLIWLNLAWQTDAHLAEFGVRLPTETRILLARIRDISDAMAETERRNWRRAALDTAKAAPEASQHASEQSVPDAVDPPAPRLAMAGGRG
ncbi:MAG: hypothetical protein AAGE13_13370 [Pseudomonadota bacterium]